MSKLNEFKIVEMPAMKIVGKAIRNKMDVMENPIPDFWTKCFSDGTFAALEALDAAALDGSYVGLMCDWKPEDNCFTYICGIFMIPDCPIPEGLMARDIPAASVAVGYVRGPEKENYMQAHALTSEALERSGKKPDEAASWCAEVYNCPRFTAPQENGDVILDYYIPCL